MEKRLRGQRLGNVGLNVDEKRKKEGVRHGPKASAGLLVCAHVAEFFRNIFEKNIFFSLSITKK